VNCYNNVKKESGDDSNDFGESESWPTVTHQPSFGAASGK
jgi:hypothetical protein